MNRLYKRLGYVAALIAAGGTFAVAQETGSLVVTVRDKAGAPVANAKVTASSATQIGGARIMTSDAQGRVRFGALYPGQFSVVVEAPGHQTASLKAVHVGVSAVAQAEVRLAPAQAVTVEVIASAAAIDTASTTSSARLNLEVIDSLPTGRTYTDFARFAPGVVASPDHGKNFAIAGSLSRDNTGGGGARNNTYILDGVDTTSPNSGGALSEFNSEIIQEQEIKVGGISADVGARGGGLVSNVVTKSGSNAWSGSLNYYFNTANMESRRQPGTVEKPRDFRKSDTAFTLGGPILKDRWWFFTSIQKKLESSNTFFSDTAAPSTPKKPEQDDTLAFFKTAFQVTAGQLVELSIHDNKTKEKSVGSVDNIPGWDSDRDRHDRIANLRYEAVFGDWVLTGKGFLYDNESKRAPKRGDNIAIIYPDAPFNGLEASSTRNNYEKQLGGFGWYTNTTLRRTGYSLDVQKFQANLFGDHQFKAGALFQEETRTSRLLHSGNGADYENLAFNPNSPGGSTNNMVWADVVNNFGGASWADAEFTTGALDRARTTNAALDAYLTGLGSYDNIPFQTFAPGATNQILQYRIAGLRYGNDAKVKRKSTDLYLQDTWTLPGNLFTAYLGARVNKDSYYADDGSKLHSTETNIAPRVGLTYNHKGENKLKIFTTFGRYFEPIKLDMVTFAGSFKNARVEQMYIPYQSAPSTYDARNWVTLRQRGGRETVDAMMAPSLQSPYTDEYRLGTEYDFGQGLIGELSLTHREDKRIVEDFDLYLYTDPDALMPSAGRMARILAQYPGTTAAEWNARYRALAYPITYFGLNAIPANVNYVLANLAGAERKFDVFNLSFRRQDTGDGWTAFFNYTYTKSKGNSLSSGDADFQGDTPHLDPRLPWMNGHVIGNSDMQWKTYLAKTIKEGWAKGVTLGASFTHVRGIHWTPGLGLYGRILQGPYTAGFDTEPGRRLGADHNQLDLRVKYDVKFGEKVKGEFFMDIFNFTDNQAPSFLEESTNGVSVNTGLGTRTRDQSPRRIWLGARVSF